MIRRAATAVVFCVLSMTFSGVLLAPQAFAGQYTHTDPNSTGSWTTPSYVDVAQVIVEGARGGNGLATGVGAVAGSGGTAFGVSAALDLSSGQVVTFGLGKPGGDANGTNGSTAGGASGFSAGAGGNGNFNTFSYSGGGGGGASLARLDGATVAISAGGGGGGGADHGGLDPNSSGGGGGNAGFAAFPWSSDYLDGSNGTAGSSTGTQAGGAASGLTPGSAGTGSATAGSGSSGGNGDTNSCSGGGGGAGAAGGGGGGSDPNFASLGCSGGGAGSSFVDRTKTVTNGAMSVSSTGSAYGQVNYIDFTTTTLADGVAGNSYSASVIATFGAATTPDGWSVTPALPAGLSLNTSTGAITGTPTSSASGTYTITASYSDGLYLRARSSQSFTLLITSAPAPDPSPESTSAPASTPWAAPLLSTGGGPWTVTQGEPTIVIPAVNSGGFGRFTISPSLPVGLDLNVTSGVISGTPLESTEVVSYTLASTNELGTSSVFFRLGVDAPKQVASQDSSVRDSIGAVTFAPRSHLLSEAMKKTLLIQLTQRSKITPLSIVSIVPRSHSERSISLAQRRGAEVRRFLREEGYSVNSTITLEPARTTSELRTVMLVPSMG